MSFSAVNSKSCFTSVILGFLSLPIHGLQSAPAVVRCPKRRGTTTSTLCSVFKPSRRGHPAAWLLVLSLGYISQPFCNIFALLTPFRKFDDFIVTHIQQTLEIHFSGIFMPWHRWFVHTYEKALRDECGYKGYQPVSLVTYDGFPTPGLC
jgi:hypothetical protein